jgi:CHAD domain-containing protein
MKEPTMTTATLPRLVSRRSELLQDELQDELRHIRDLVFIRDLLRERAETSTELREGWAQLAELAKRASVRYASAA